MQDASGWYRLLNSNVGRQRHFAVKKHIDLNNSTIGRFESHLKRRNVILRAREARLRITLGTNNHVLFSFTAPVTVPPDPDMEEDLVVVDYSDVDQQHSGPDEVGSCLATGASSLGPSSAKNSSPRQSQATELKGKTPYTTTMTLKKGPKGFGFSVTWTHPPRYRIFSRNVISLIFRYIVVGTISNAALVPMPNLYFSLS